MKASLLLALLPTLIIPATASASNWTVDVSHSRVAFSVRHLMVSNTRGHFAKFEGTVTLDDKDVTKSQVTVSIDAASIDTDDQKRDEHLKSPDFFNVAEHGKLTFESTAIKKTKNGLKITGKLTIKGVTKTVTLDAEGGLAPVSDPWGNSRLGFAASTKINRSDFGLTWNKTLEAGGVVVGEQVRIDLDVELIKQK